MKMIVIDADYKFDKKNTPVIRLFGKSIDDSENETNICLHIYGFEPYMYIGVPDGLNINDFIKIIEKNFTGYYKKLEIVKRFKPLGYQIEKSDMLKFTLYNPRIVPIVKKMLITEIEEMSDDLIYEADILFRDRFMIDTGINGMSVIKFNEFMNKLDNYGINSDNLYIIGMNDFKVTDEIISIDY